LLVGCTTAVGVAEDAADGAVVVDVALLVDCTGVVGVALAAGGDDATTGFAAG
jgi:hypothetical protein